MDGESQRSECAILRVHQPRSWLHAARPHREEAHRIGPFERTLSTEDQGVAPALQRPRAFRREARREEQRAVHFLTRVMLASLRIWL
jgi:hypothetical protein